MPAERDVRPLWLRPSGAWAGGAAGYSLPAGVGARPGQVVGGGSVWDGGCLSSGCCLNSDGNGAFATWPVLKSQTNPSTLLLAEFR